MIDTDGTDWVCVGVWATVTVLLGTFWRWVLS